MKRTSPGRWIRAAFLVALMSAGVGASGEVGNSARAGETGAIAGTREAAGGHRTLKDSGPFRIAAATSPVPTPNQAAWDARFYDLDLNLDPVARILTGAVRVRAQVLEGPLTTIELDLDDNMIVTAARSAGLPAGFARGTNRVAVTLERPYLAGETIDAAIDYHGSPYGGWFNFDTHSGQPMIWSLSEPFGARSWWPCKDDPSDKADSADIRLTVPSGLVAASNGRRVSSTAIGPSAVTVWHERHPIATYLVSVAVHPYVTYSDWWRWSPSDSMEIQFYMYPDQLSRTTPGNALVGGMLDVYSGLFGPYPFRDEKYGHAQFPVDGGMEHQTIGSLGNYTESVVAHELAHQWWGDLVTCRDFRHFWLNEGFASYAEGLWYEAKSGSAALREDLSYNVFFGPGTVYIPDLDLVDSASEFDLYYNRPSWVLHMLRHVLGDPAFFSSLAAYRAAHAFGTATTDEFRTACEQTSGRDLSRFFQQWIYGERYPEYRFDWSAAPAGGGYDVTLSIEQRQSWQTFAMPIDVRVETAGGPASFVVNDSLPSQVFTLHTAAEPVAVVLDPDDFILKTVERPVVAPAFDRGTLVVNGVSFDSAGTDIRSAYVDRAFSGDYPIDFWDIFPAPPGGYPPALPPPLGHGDPPREILGRYRNVIWVGDHRGGDLSAWLRSPIPSYLEAGGNVVLLTRLGTQFLHERLRDYLGLHWASGDRIFDYLPTWPGLAALNRLTTMSSCAVFDLTLDRTDSHVIYKADFNYNPDRGVGVWRKPDGGGTFRPGGGQFVFLSGRPQYWVHADLRAAMTTILHDFFGEPSDVSGVPPPAEPRAGVARVGRPQPNPFRDATRWTIALPTPAPIHAVVLDVNGRQVRRLMNGGVVAAGETELVWDGRNDRGRRAGAGVYWIRMTVEAETTFRKVVVVR